jgi:hypothetical protein
MEESDYTVPLPTLSTIVCQNPKLETVIQKSRSTTALNDNTKVKIHNGPQ